ncbi:MAG: hypothetical protein JRN11_07305 [Nitrososphaerota archaeon]|nr:hypothetical protein [Nitrososphaerota archaeon]MDG7026537.1 hypothetical protein [Nitrososphaerota archaeon]
MVRILWFKETTRWSRRGIPLRVVWVSPRQLVILLFSVLAGLVAATPLPTATLKLVPMGVFLVAGALVAFWRVKMLTPEQLIMVRLRGLTTISQDSKKSGKSKTISVVERPDESAFEIEADSADSFTPLSITGSWKRTKLPRKVALYVDGVPRAGAEALATPVNDAEGGYTIVFLPTAADIGVRELEVRIEGEEKPIYRKKVEVKVKGARSLEMKKVS